MLTVLVVDDHRVVRAGIRRLIDAEDGLRTVAEAGTVAEAVAAAREHQPTVVIVDVSLGAGNGIDAIPAIAEVAPGTAILILSMEEEPTYVMRSLEAGAHGYVPKSSADGELIEAVRVVAAGGRYVPNVIAIRVADARARKRRESPNAPTSAVANSMSFVCSAWATATRRSPQRSSSRFVPSSRTGRT